MRELTLWSIVLVLLLCFSTSSYGKASCKKYLNKLHLIQAKQRQGHSLNRSNTLNQQESKARDKWWKCEKRPSTRKNKSKKNKLKKKKAKGKSKYKNTKMKKTQNLTNAPIFSSSSAINVKEKFEGKKKYAWLDYYQQPEKCKKPKKLSVFAYCAEDRQAQQHSFDRSYQQ